MAALNEIEAEKAKAFARLELRTAAAQQPAQAPPHNPHSAAQSQTQGVSRAELYEAVRVAYAADPAFSRAELARQTGWSESMIRKVLKEIATDKE